MLNKKEFSVLTYIEANQNEKLTQKELSEALNFSVGTVNKLWNELEEKGFIEDKHIRIKWNNYKIRLSYTCRIDFYMCNLLLIGLYIINMNKKNNGGNVYEYMYNYI